ncbi:MAG: tRNA 2-selenouridine synthase [Chlamydiales bacterium]|jgi:tRNA 2-selenouridine synthase
MPEILAVEPFIETQGTIIDVRSPAEYAKGHIPLAINIPLFTNAERSEVGTTYKQVGVQEAINLGLSIIEPQIPHLISKARETLKGQPAKVHCWRGGMRSSSVAELLELTGTTSSTLEGGYKSFRNWALENLQKPRKLRVIGGLTGSNKTHILHALESMGEQVLDLEGLANHRGSAFGKVGEQPTSEQFENNIAIKWASFSTEKPVWVEDESRLIGFCSIPKNIFNGMQAAPLFKIDVPLSERHSNLEKDYGNFEIASVMESTQRLSKKLGGLRTKGILSLIESGDYLKAGKMVLEYYDKAYQYSLSKRKQPISTLTAHGLSPHQWAHKILQFSKYDSWH